MRWKTAAMACLCLAALSAGAQVHRCKDATGKTAYSDRPCEAGQAGVQIERQRSRSDIRQERLQAYQADMRKQERRMAQGGAFVPSQSQARSQPASQRPTDDWQSRKDRENAATSARSITANGGKWDNASNARRHEEARRRDVQQRPASPAHITHCDDGFCYGSKGVYHKAGPGVMTGPNGKTCHQAGTTWNCN